MQRDDADAPFLITAESARGLVKARGPPCADAVTPPADQTHAQIRTIACTVTRPCSHACILLCLQGFFYSRFDAVLDEHTSQVHQHSCIHTTPSALDG